MAQISPSRVLGGHEKRETHKVNFSDGDVLETSLDRVLAAHVTALSEGQNVGADASVGADEEVELHTSAAGSIDAYVTVIGT